MFDVGDKVICIDNTRYLHNIRIGTECIIVNINGDCIDVNGLHRIDDRIIYQSIHINDITIPVNKMKVELDDNLFEVD